MKPEYYNRFDKPVFKVNNMHISKKGDLYEVQLNDRYFLFTEEMLISLTVMSKTMGDGMGFSIG